MKVVFLNTWNGKQESELRKFLDNHIIDTDVFCFQEAYESMQAITRGYFGNFNQTDAYALAFKDETGVEDFAQTTYVRKEHQILRTELISDKDRVRGLGIDTLIDYKGTKVHILNYQGVSKPNDKLDTADRINQSHGLVHYLDQQDGPKILGGDFNFLPNTEAYSIIKSAGYAELIMGHAIKTTRNRLYWDSGPHKLLYSDYVFTSSDVEVEAFSVPELEVSDHLPIIINLNFRL